VPTTPHPKAASTADVACFRVWQQIGLGVAEEQVIRRLALREQPPGDPGEPDLRPHPGIADLPGLLDGSGPPARTSLTPPPVTWPC
jgi:hypothetical protein